jgi:hypothetical protein
VPDGLDQAVVAAYNHDVDDREFVALFVEPILNAAADRDLLAGLYCGPVP